ncbi:hypothetical protein BSZ36_02935 [Rubricoccus marinus]|uniref:Spore coat protein CotH n=1 Tax=Rubricoccus marinus TaxID=716817 RepID=A0A259TW81_9BACT|nr:hypothetical protein BSZ36_02935 [Rubricoccus marinus]
MFLRSRFVCVLLLALAASGASAQPFESSDLPLVIVDVGREIPNEPKVEGRMRIVDNGPGERNRPDDAATGYDGPIGIELRGATSRTKYAKKQYAVETRDEAGANLNVPLLGFPEENDWILHAPYSDKTLMRNVLAYRLAREMGQYASRTRYVELILDGEYQGVYVLMEKIKRDDGRVDIATLNPDETSGDDLTGGYIVKIDKRSGGERGGWLSPVRAPGWGGSGRPLYQFHDPKPSEIAPEQAAYIENWISDFERALMAETIEDPARGYPAFIDLASFVDYFLLVELSKNVDGYRLSAYFHKDKDSNGGLLRAGPVWDVNIGFGNADYYSGADPEGWQVLMTQAEDPFQIPAWWPRLVQTESFQSAARARWAELRAGPLATDSLVARVDGIADQLDEAQARNFQRWPVLGRRIWPNEFVGETYAEEVDFLRSWLRQRLAWMDGELLAEP